MYNNMFIYFVYICKTNCSFSKQKRQALDFTVVTFYLGQACESEAEKGKSVIEKNWWTCSLSNISKKKKVNVNMSVFLASAGQARFPDWSGCWRLDMLSKARKTHRGRRRGWWRWWPSPDSFDNKISSSLREFVNWQLRATRDPWELSKKEFKGGNTWQFRLGQKNVWNKKHPQDFSNNFGQPGTPETV